MAPSRHLRVGSRLPLGPLGLSCVESAHERVSGDPVMATRGREITAGPSVMEPAGQQEGPLPGGQNQTAVGRPPRPDNRAAKEVGEMERQKVLALTRDVR